MPDTKERISEKDLKTISPASSANIWVFIRHLSFDRKDTYLFKHTFNQRKNDYDVFGYLMDLLNTIWLILNFMFKPQNHDLYAWAKEKMHFSRFWDLFSTLKSVSVIYSYIRFIRLIGLFDSELSLLGSGPIDKHIQSFSTKLGNNWNHTNLC